MNTKIKVELRDADVRKDLTSLLNDMDAIRAESAAKGVPQQPKEYQKLAFRMSNCFKGLYSDKWGDSINSLETATSENPLLQNYDRFQIHYWAENKDGKPFLQNLAGLAMDFFAPDDFVEFFAKNGEYHLLQALNIVSGNIPAPLREGMLITLAVSLEDMQDPLKVVQAYQRLGHARAVFKVQNTDKTAGNLIKLGYDARIDGDKVSVLFKQPGADALLNAAFGYTKISRQGDLYLAFGQGKHCVLLKNGSKCSINGEDTFEKAAVTKTGTIEVRKDKKWGYLNSGGHAYFERFFEERLTEGLAEKIAGLESKVGREKTEWLINSDVPLESLSKLSSKGVELIYAAEIKPSMVLLTRAKGIAAKVADFSSFARAYDAVRAVELPGEKTFWEMLDGLSPEAVQPIIDNAIQASITHGAKLPLLMQAYQDRRLTHASEKTLLASAIDYISTIRKVV